MKHTYINKRKFIRSLILTTVITSYVIALLLVITGNFFSNATEITSYIDYEVRRGDTVWDIALNHNPNNHDVRQVVYQITEANSIVNADIYPGQVLRIPWEVEGNE